jgi:predicted tellurium resistance membrane protein TerC
MDGMDNIIIMVIIKIKIQTNNKRDRMIKYHIIVTNILRIYIHITMNNNGVI